MTAFDRIERHLPELMDELATAGIPDYFDDMLQQTAQSRQRPAWSALERWLPMGVIARPLPFRPMPWRLIAIVALVGLLATATLVYVGSRPRIPAPFGPASNGVLIIGTADGDIVSVDPSTGTTTALIGGPTIDAGPYFSNDGQRFIFDRGTSASGPSRSYIANADGSNVHELLPAGRKLNWFEWASSSDRALIVETIAGKKSLSIIDVVDGRSTRLGLDLDVQAAAWRPIHDEIIVTAKAGDARTFWVIHADGSGVPRQIPVSPYAINEPTLSADGTKLAYATWEPTVLPGRIRVVDIDSGGDHAITTVDGDGAVWQSPQFSPDGTHLLLYRFIAGSDPAVAQLAIMDVADGSAITMGPLSQNPQPAAIFSPDGTKIVADYPALDATWMFDADGQNGHEAPFSAIGGEGATWQRVAR
jgi:tricorn protease-like protein